MSNQWFYINRWKQNREENWVIVNKLGEIIKENVSKYSAEAIKYRLEIEDEHKHNEYFIVNKNDSRYNEIVSHINLKKREKNENN